MAGDRLELGIEDYELDETFRTSLTHLHTRSLIGLWSISSATAVRRDWQRNFHPSSTRRRIYMRIAALVPIGPNRKHARVNGYVHSLVLIAALAGIAGRAHA